MHYERSQLLDVTVDRRTARRMMEIGRERDINRGGYCDARSGCINFWCGPDDRPDCWPAAITQGGLNHPRDYVGAVYFEWEGDDRARLKIDVVPYRLQRDAARRAAVAGERRANEAPVSEVELATALDWVRAKTLDLLAAAQKEM